MAFQCDACGRRITPEEVQSLETEGGPVHHCPACARSAGVPPAELFVCDGDGCGKPFPVQLLREGKAGVAANRVLCPRCLFRTVGLQRRRVDAWMVTSILLVVLVFPVVTGALLSGKSSDEHRDSGRGAPLSGAPQLPVPARQEEAMTREEMIELLREFVADMRPAVQPEQSAEVPGAAPGPGQAGPPPGGPHPEDPPAQKTGATGDGGPNPPRPTVDLEALDDQIDGALRDALFEQLGGPAGPEGLLDRLGVLASIRTAGRADWGDDLSQHFADPREDEIVRAVAASTAGRLRSGSAAAPLRKAAAEDASAGVREACRQALWEILGRPAGDPASDRDVDWRGAFERHARAVEKNR